CRVFETLCTAAEDIAERNDNEIHHYPCYDAKHNSEYEPVSDKFRNERIEREEDEGEAHCDEEMKSNSPDYESLTTGESIAAKQTTGDVSKDGLGAFTSFDEEFDHCSADVEGAGD